MKYKLFVWKTDKKGNPKLIESRRVSDFWRMCNLRDKRVKKGYEVHVIQVEK